MLIKPRIGRLRLPVHSSFYVAIIRRFCFTASITPPNMLAMQFDFISEIVIDSNGQFSDLINIVHYLLEFKSMTALFYAGFWVGNEQICVNHLMN
jgi:hypothetical protein